MKLQRFLAKNFRHSPSRAPPKDLNPFAGFLSADHSRQPHDQKSAQQAANRASHPTPSSSGPSSASNSSRPSTSSTGSPTHSWPSSSASSPVCPSSPANKILRPQVPSVVSSPAAFRQPPSRAPPKDLNPFAGFLSANPSRQPHDQKSAQQAANRASHPTPSSSGPSSASNSSRPSTSSIGSPLHSWPSSSASSPVSPSSPANKILRPPVPSVVSTPATSPGPRIRIRKRPLVDELFQLENDKLVEAFKIIDINGDGKISEQELGLMWKRLGKKISDKELKLMIREADANGDGELDLQEFVAFHSKMVVHPEIDDPIQHADAVRVAFGVSDLGRDGLISAAELQTTMQRLGKRKVTATECAAMIRWVDSDGDSLITFTEFEKVMMSSVFARKF